jgi:hypothetical protein
MVCNNTIFQKKKNMSRQNIMFSLINENISASMKINLLYNNYV